MAAAGFALGTTRFPSRAIHIIPHRFMGQLCAPLMRLPETLSISPGLTAASLIRAGPGNADHPGDGALTRGEGEGLLTIG